jgi:hypothetical protein
VASECNGEREGNREQEHHYQVFRWQGQVIHTWDYVSNVMRVHQVHETSSGWLLTYHVAPTLVIEYAELIGLVDEFWSPLEPTVLVW